MSKGYNTVQSSPTWPKLTILKLNSIRQIEIYLGYIFTCGVLYLLSLWNKEIATWPFDQDESGNHILIEDEDETFTIEEFFKVNIAANSINLAGTSNILTIDTFIHRYIRYYRNQEGFSELKFECNTDGKTVHSIANKPLSIDQVKEKKMIFGHCLIDIKIPNLFALLKEGVFHPFFIFQIFSCILWVFEEYYVYACAIFIMSMVSLVFNLMQTRNNIKAVRDLALYECKVTVFRDQWVEISSKELVPGDLIKLKEGVIMPADVILTKGMCLVDESMLTGESLLIVKEGIPNSSSIFYHKEKKFTVSAGTLPKICRHDPTGIVVATGFSTAKGDLVRSVLYPKPNRFSFYADSFKFIGIMGIFGFIGFIWALGFLLHQGAGAKTIIIRTLDLITIVVPPVLPLVLTIGTSFSISRLKKLNISCISLPAVNAAGRVSVVVFDKTGTITEDWMSLKGVFVEEFIDAKMTEYHCQENMAVCNSLTYINGKIEGDPQEIAIFNNVGWDTVESDGGWTVTGPNGPVEVLHIYHFSSESKRMAVISKNNSGLFLHIKGAPETIKPICANIPTNFEDSVKSFTQEGYRVMACAYKSLDSFDADTPLSSLESNLTYLGLLILENPLKKDSSDTIRTLQLSEIKCIISTGDSHLTGISVAKSCGIINPRVPLYTGEMIKGRLNWKDPTGQFGFLPKMCSIAMTGEMLEYMINNQHPDLERVIRQGAVFGRMFPHQKIMLIEILQGTDTMVAMVGDGANDCGALKKADVGLSLSKAEASIAAPFSTEDIVGIVHVLKEGRNALVTSLQSFKFVAMYSFIQFTAVSILYALENNLMDMQFLYQDLVIILPISVSMANSHPYHTLSKTLPPGNLFSTSIIGSLAGHLLINIIFQVSTFFSMLPFDWYEHESGSTDDPISNNDNTAIFIIACFQVLIAGIVFNIGPPYRRNTLENFWFTGATSFIVLMTIYLVMVPDTFGSLFDVVDLDPAFRWIIIIFALGNLLACFLHEKMFLPKIEDE